MFRDVPACSSMFRNVPCSGFYRRPRIKDYLYHLQTVKLLFLNVKQLKRWRPILERDLKRCWNLPYVLIWCEQEWNTKLNELISVSSVGVCHCLTAIPRQNRISQVAFATVWESGFNSSCQSTQDRKFFFSCMSTCKHNKFKEESLYTGKPSKLFEASWCHTRQVISYIT